VSLAERGAAAVRRAARVLHNLPVAASVAARHLAWDPVHAQVLALRALPPGVRAAVARVGARTVLGRLALAAQGRRPQALQGLAEDGADARPRRLRRLVAAACALDDAELAGRLLARLPPGDPAGDRLAALVAVRRGDLLAARDAAGRAGRRGARLGRRVGAELATLTPQHNPTSIGATGRAGTGVDVLHLVTNALPEVQAGYTVRTQGIAAAQRRAGTDAHVATRLGFPVTIGHLDAAAEVTVEGVPYHRLLPARPLPALDDARLAADVAATDDLVRRLAPRVLHAHSKHLNAQVALAVGRRHGLAVIYEVRGFLEETWRSRGGSATSDVYRLNRDAETWCMGQADAVVTLAHSMRADLLARGLPEDRVHVVPNAVDDAYLVEPVDPAGTRAELGLPPGEVVLGVISTLNDYEGVDTLVDAVALLRQGGAPAHLLVVGDGPARRGLADRAREAGLAEHATFTGRVPRDLARRAHLATDVFCVPRRDTPVTRLVPPLKPLEAMASARPVVASDLPPLRETVRDGRTGLLVPPGDAAALAEALGPLLYDSGVRHGMGQQARSWVLEHRTWRQAAQWYDTLYRDLAGR
jgi:glycosyltransferase involved in cell wall biosynthesis